MAVTQQISSTHYHLSLLSSVALQMLTNIYFYLNATNCRGLNKLFVTARVISLVDLHLINSIADTDASMRSGVELTFLLYLFYSFENHQTQSSINLGKWFAWKLSSICTASLFTSDAGLKAIYRFLMLSFQPYAST